MNQPRRCVLDTSAVLDHILNRGCAKTARQLLSVAVIPATVLTETLYIGASNSIQPKQITKELHERGALIEPITENDARRAAQLITQSRASSNSSHCLSLGDGLCIAVAERLSLPIVGNDQHWQSLNLHVEFMSYR